MSINFEKELNKKQYEACSNESLHLRIIAGAGTGKTRVLTYRIAYLISELDIIQHRIVAITFTNKAANELKERVRNILFENNITSIHQPLVCTFHSFCNRFLRYEIDVLDGFNKQFNILDEEDSKKIKKRVCEDLNLWEDKEKRLYLFSMIGKLKSDGLLPSDIDESYFNRDSIVDGKTILKGFYMYQEALRNNNSLDFDDLLIYAVKILKEYPKIRQKWQNKFDAFLVDEFQDTNDIQYELVKLLLRHDTSLSVVGDPDQTIYSWRGANDQIIISELEKDFPDLDTVTLDMNYRSTQNILDKANMLITKNHSKLDKKLIAACNEKGENVHYVHCSDETSQANAMAKQIFKLHKDGNDYSDITIIYRANYLSRTIEKIFSSYSIPYIIYGGVKFYEREEVKTVLSYLTLLINPKDEFSFERIIQFPRIGLGDVTLKELKKIAERNNRSIFEELIYDDELKFRGGFQSNIDNLKNAYLTCLKDLSSCHTGIDYFNTLYEYLEKVNFIKCVKEKDDYEQNNSINIDKGDMRLDNVNELLKEVQEFMDNDHFNVDGDKINPSLNDYLLDVALQTSQDVNNETINSKVNDKVKLMTAHVSKGLEFPYVFIAGLDQEVFPSKHIYEDPSMIYEERRLFYVSITRAMKGLFLYSFGGYGYSGNPRVPSNFLKEIGFENKIGESQQSQFINKSSRSTQKHYFDLYGLDAQTIVSNYDEEAKKARDLLNSKPKFEKKDSQFSRVSYLSIGDRIEHVVFKQGTVIGVSGDNFTVKFDTGEIKTLKASFTKFYKKIS